jgi:predicted phage terminase large subunit-like protein
VNPAPEANVTVISPWEAAARQFEPLPRRWRTPGELGLYLDPRTTRQTPALRLIDEELVRLFDTIDGRLLLSMPPQEGKSQRVSRWFPLWALTQNPDLRIAIVSYELGVARRWGRAVRDDVVMHPELGLRVRDDLSAQHEWQLDGHLGGVYTAGIGGALTGRPVDLMIIDDPIKDREQADSEVYRARAWDWWTDTGGPRLAPGAPVVQVATRWHEEDLAGKLLGAEDGAVWTVLNIPAQAEKEDDPLGREPEEYMASVRGRTQLQWEAIKKRSGARTWASLYQGRPSPAAGDVFLREKWARYDTPSWVERRDGSMWVLTDTSEDVEIVQSWDLAFKDTKSSDYVCGQVWLRRGVTAYLLDQIHGRLAFTDTCDAIREMTARWPQAILKLVEDKANGPAVINALRTQVGGLVPVEPEGGKYARAVAITPFVEAGNVVLPSPELAPWVGAFIEEASGFPNAAHDDQVDAMTQAVHRLLLVPILRGIVEQDELIEDDLSWSATY